MNKSKRRILLSNRQIAMCYFSMMKASYSDIKIIGTILSDEALQRWIMAFKVISYGRNYIKVKNVLNIKNKLMNKKD